MISSKTFASLRRACLLTDDTHGLTANTMIENGDIFLHSVMIMHHKWRSDDWMPSFVSVYEFRSLGGIKGGPVYVLLEHHSSYTFGPFDQDDSAGPGRDMLLRRAYVTKNRDDILDYAANVRMASTS
jgi:hypothetical protein